MVLHKELSLSDLLGEKLHSPVATGSNSTSAATPTGTNPSPGPQDEYSPPSPAYPCPSIQQLRKREKNRLRRKRRLERVETRVSERCSYRLTQLLVTIHEKCVELQKQAHHWAVDCQETEFAKLRAAEANALLAVTRLFKQIASDLRRLTSSSPTLSSRGTTATNPCTPLSFLPIK